MNWGSLTIGRRIAIGFSVVLLLLCLAGALSYLGVGDIVGDAKQVIDGNKLDGILAQREVDHLNWANAVNALITDENVTQLKVQTDPKKCGFGKWYYGEGRKQAESLAPSLKPLLDKIEQPHALLHGSAEQIKKTFKQPHPGLMNKLSSVLAAHLDWAAMVSKQLAIESGGLNSYQSMLKNQINQALVMLIQLTKTAAQATEASKQNQMIDILRQMRFGSENQDYFFILNQEGDCILHPIKPELEGKSLLGVKDPNGKAFLQRWRIYRKNPARDL
jgi:methyl-accepting chemotaxis protein